MQVAQPLVVKGAVHGQARCPARRGEDDRLPHRRSKRLRRLAAARTHSGVTYAREMQVAQPLVVKGAVRGQARCPARRGEDDGLPHRRSKRLRRLAAARTHSGVTYAPEMPPSTMNVDAVTNDDSSDA